ncbi:hypothetical protein WD_0178 [Wolbachia endosymbiont of Drosophila melanogaster]|uniref:hypothetical protein n=1 Tax=Wolbachia TaxID=953 RepID=UPI000023B904|nr:MULTISPECIES: hypothetical protein [Wolbachia]AAS13927.1 hypothetical protein WD_0178 [Wolbachia endosymbiont of Drosophila melanogaster]ERN56006.1 hypothetical protein WMELPOP_01583 [Wolbachia pipientis wMelPop]MCE4149345.1 hypothetical protein [Wolbachia endosymbiont of Drosophila melanogaster]MCE4150341.1 hypothetical protein [Wolbachia endosymbiont of Drosophila melanogaster]POG50359.1 hypothetical protein BK222_00675 [Wolbachia sp. wMel_AMD]
MTTDCKAKMLNCISKYIEELGENKAAIKQTLTNDKINISDHFYQGDKICNEEIFNVGGECQDTKHGNSEYTYDDWKQKIEKSHAKDLLKMLQDKAKDKILKSFEDYEKYHENAVEAIKRELDMDSQLKCRDLNCFDRTIKDNLSQKQSELTNIKNNFLDDTQNIFKYIQVEDNI